MTQDQLFRMGLFNAVQELHMNITGASDTCNYGHYTMKDIYEALCMKVAEWKEPPVFTSKYDLAVKLVVYMVIFEYEEYIRKGI